jgi:hypothetical protein
MHRNSIIDVDPNNDDDDDVENEVVDFESKTVHSSSSPSGYSVGMV